MEDLPTFVSTFVNVFVYHYLFHFFPNRIKNIYQCKHNSRKCLPVISHWKSSRLDQPGQYSVKDVDL